MIELYKLLEEWDRESDKGFTLAELDMFLDFHDYVFSGGEVLEKLGPHTVIGNGKGECVHFLSDVETPIVP